MCCLDKARMRQFIGFLPSWQGGKVCCELISVVGTLWCYRQDTIQLPPRIQIARLVLF